MLFSVERKIMVNRDPRHSTRNSNQYSMITYMGEESEKEWIYMIIWLIYFAVHLTLTQNCMSTVLL